VRAPPKTPNCVAAAVPPAPDIRELEQQMVRLTEEVERLSRALKEAAARTLPSE